MKLGVIGGGAMGSALLSGIAQGGVFPADQIGLSEPNPERAQALASELGIQVLSGNQAAAQAEILLLAVKPQVFPGVAHEIAADLTADLVVSVMAGISCQMLEALFPGRSVVRTMPNTPALVGEGMTAISGGSLTTSEQLQQVKELLEAVGQVVILPESQLDAVTAVSGSGPGYLALIAEAMIDGGVKAGLPRDLAMQLVFQTLKGTGILLQQEGRSPASLKDRVTSPGGTTIAGISVLEENGVRGAIIEAIEAAQGRSLELGNS